MSDWLLNYFEEGLKNKQNEEKPEGWFSVQSIYNVPYINYCGLSSEQCAEVQQQIQNVLRSSRNSNHFKEATIVYSLDDKREHHDIYVKKMGDVSCVDSEEISFQDGDSNKELVVVSFVNHTGNGAFSMEEMAFFCTHSNVKLMTLVNAEGKVSYLIKTQKTDLKNVVMFHILDTCPDFQTKFQDWKLNHPKEENFKISHVIKGTEVQGIIIKEIMHDLQEKGVLRKDYVQKTQQDERKPEESKQDAVNPVEAQQPDSKQSDSQSDKDLQLGGALFASSKIVKADAYYDNGDDGYAWGGPKEKIVEKKIVHKNSK